MRRYILTGAPGAGKTTILAGLRERGYPVVDEAATDVIARRQREGHPEPWTAPGFLDAILDLQVRRQRQPVRRRRQPDTGPAWVFDRSPICTLALARYADLPVPPALAGEVDRIVAEGFYRPTVFFVRLLGFVTPTAARRITFEESVRFEGIHERVYREHGFELVEVPAGPLDERVDQIDGYIRSSRTVS
jgi:predicted ATPase